MFSSKTNWFLNQSPLTKSYAFIWPKAGLFWQFLFFTRDWIFWCGWSKPYPSFIEVNLVCVFAVVNKKLEFGTWFFWFCRFEQDKAEKTILWKINKSNNRYPKRDFWINNNFGIGAASSPKLINKNCFDFKRTMRIILLPEDILKNSGITNWTTV